MASSKPPEPEAQLIEAGLLLDTYGDLLTERQREFMRLHFEEDLSFSAIAREHGISRQAVHDSVRHAVGALRRFEQALGLVAKRREGDEAAGPQIGGRQLIERLEGMCRRLEAAGPAGAPGWVTDELRELIGLLAGGEEASA